MKVDSVRVCDMLPVSRREMVNEWSAKQLYDTYL
jgi:hypothetical protein